MMKIEHANITVRSADEAIRFLGAAFPDSRIRGGGHTLNSGPGRWVHFGNDDAYIALQENETSAGRQDVTYTNEGINHVGFIVEDLEAIMARLRVEGYCLTQASAMDHPHRRRAYYLDGNGIEWEFVEYCSNLVAERNDYRT